MPMYDFVCQQCGHEFEDLVKKGREIFCPKCYSDDVKQKLSIPSPLKTGAFPFKPGPVRPIAYSKPTGCAHLCGTNACPSSQNAND